MSRITERMEVMMRALVVYESMFGNTRNVAEAIGEGLGARMPVEVLEVSAAPTRLTDDVGLVVVGGPTHAFGMSRSSTRASATKETDAPLVSPGRGIREWLAALRVEAEDVAGATFDTRMRRLPGSAARPALRRLRRLGVRAATRPARFTVEGTKGPLAEGELERARRWGKTLAASLDARHRQPT